MTTDPVTAAARKWCREKPDGAVYMLSDAVCRAKIAAAVREALEEVEKALRLRLDNQAASNACAALAALRTLNP